MKRVFYTDFLILRIIYLFICFSVYNEFKTVLKLNLDSLKQPTIQRDIYEIDVINYFVDLFFCTNAVILSVFKFFYFILLK